MFENLFKLFKKENKREILCESSKDTAKERLHLVLMQDRANVSADFLELMKQEIIDVIKKYIVVDEDSIDVRLTNQENEDGTNGAPALYANIPIVNIKNDMMAEKIKSFEGVDFNKEMGINVKSNQKTEDTSVVIELPENVTKMEKDELREDDEQLDNEEMFEEVDDDDDDDDVTFDDLLKAAEAADKLNGETENKESNEEIEIKPAKKETSRSKQKKKN